MCASRRQLLESQARMSSCQFHDQLPLVGTENAVLVDALRQVSSNIRVSIEVDTNLEEFTEIRTILPRAAVFLAESGGRA
jgi:hypothetical protein